MGILTKKTAKMLCMNSAIARNELVLEAQKLVDLCDDPDVLPSKKDAAKRALDRMIDRLEKKVETRRLTDGDQG